MLFIGHMVVYFCCSDVCCHYLFRSGRSVYNITGRIVDVLQMVYQTPSDNAVMEDTERALCPADRKCIRVEFVKPAEFILTAFKGQPASNFNVLIPFCRSVKQLLLER